jgi:hypothetical protein
VSDVLSLWRHAVDTLSQLAVLILNADDPGTAPLGENHRRVVYFGVEGTYGEPPQNNGTAQERFLCLCGARLDYASFTMGHLGDWSCTTCGRRRPTPDFLATDLDLRDGRSQTFVCPAAGGRIDMGLGGVHNTYNALAAIAATSALGFSIEESRQAISAEAAAVSSGGRFLIEGRTVELLLAKNPIGLNQTLSMIALGPVAPGGAVRAQRWSRRRQRQLLDPRR